VDNAKDVDELLWGCYCTGSGRLWSIFLTRLDVHSGSKALNCFGWRFLYSLRFVVSVFLPLLFRVDMAIYRRRCQSSREPACTLYFGINDSMYILFFFSFYFFTPSSSSSSFPFFPSLFPYLSFVLPSIMARHPANLWPLQQGPMKNLEQQY
jgi:hypothetical protein